MSIHQAETVVLETTKGNIEIELNRAKAPVTVDNFVKYVKMASSTAQSSTASYRGS